MSIFAPRKAITTHQCPKCGQPLAIKRSCHNVYLECENCKTQYKLEQYIQKADQAMEDFLENVYFDRI